MYENGLKMQFHFKLFLSWVEVNYFNWALLKNKTKKNKTKDKLVQLV